MKSIRDISNLDHSRHAMNIVACDAHVNARPGKIRIVLAQLRFADSMLGADFRMANVQWGVEVSLRIRLTCRSWSAYDARKLGACRRKIQEIEDQVCLAAIRRSSMNRELALKVVLAAVGLLFVALLYPMVVFVRQAPALSMQFSLYVTLGVFLLLAIRNPSASRSVIAFTAWSSFAHAALMGTQACRNMVARGELIGVAVLVIIGAALIALAPPKQLLQSASHPSQLQSR
jgi:hypothetical protein